MSKLEIAKPDFLKVAEDALIEANNALQGEVERRKLLGGPLATRTESLEIMRLTVMELVRAVRTRIEADR